MAGTGPGCGSRGIIRRRPVIVVPVLAVVSLVAGLLVAAGVVSAGWGKAPAASAGSPVAVHRVAGRTVKIPPMPAWHHGPVSWPAAGSGTAGFSARVSSPAGGHAAGMSAAATAGSARAGSLPVWVGQPAGSGPVVAVRPAGGGLRGPAPGKAGQPAAGGSAVAFSSRTSLPAGQPVSRVSVSMSTRQSAAALGVRGVVFTVTRSDGSGAAGRVHVSLDYTSFAAAYGGGYASRLHLVELPACALTTPQVAACRTQVPVLSADDVHHDVLGADVILPGLSAAAAAGPPDSGAGAVVTTAQLTQAPAPLVLAAVAASQGPGGNWGAEPLAETNQWVTGGSSGAYTYSYPVQVPPVPGGLQPSVSLDYSSQTTDGLNASTNNQASWIGDGWTYEPGFVEADYPTCATIAADPDTLDLCNGAGPQPTQFTVTLNGTTTPLVMDATNGTHLEADGGQQVNATANGGYEIIEPDGTQYWFGVNQLPGYATGDQATNSIWTVPLRDAGFAARPWRWMLDYVVDPKGNAIAYFYNTQTNYYAENGGTKGTGQYTQGGVLATIEYGLRAGNIYAQTPAAQVTFTTYTTSATVRADAPTDLTCAQNAACTVTAPTFWTSYALTGIRTQSLVNGTLQNVDSWALAGTYPATRDTTTTPSLWLSGITRTGQDGSAAIPLPPVSFSGIPMPNLDPTAADKRAGHSLITRYRLTSITNESGGVTTVNYSTVDSHCAAGTFPKDYTNTGLCYPDYWWTDPLALNSQEDWFNLYDVTSVTQKDTTGGSPPQVTAYTDTGPAWHYDNDTMSRSAIWTWDQWRGFQSVITETGTAPDPVTETADTYLQGMSQDQSDYRFQTGIITNGQINLTSSRGSVTEDKNQYAGMKFEEITYNGAGTGAQVSDTIWFPTTIKNTASQPKLFQSAYITSTGSSETYTALAGGGSRESATTYAYNAAGQVITESDVPDTTDASQSKCTSTTYDVNTATSVWILSLPDDVNVSSGTCGASGATTISDTQYSYDGGVFGAAPNQGNLTQVNQLGATASGSSVTHDFTYDGYGRVLTSTDGDARRTATAYTPTTAAEPTSVQVTDPAGLVTTTTYDPARNLATGVTDPAGYQTAETYDALGRITARWTPGNPASGPAVDTYTYTVSNVVPSVSTAQIQSPGGGRTAETIYDSFGRVRETQTATAGGGTDVSDDAYNSDGWKLLTSDPYYISGAPTGTLVVATSSSLSLTGYVYDGAGRVTKEVAYNLGTETWETDTTYGGNYVTVVPPTGGTSSTTFTDGRGLTTAIYQYHTGVSVSPSGPATDYDKTAYTYTPAGKLSAIADAAGNTWSYTYDQLGNQLTQTDPDAGMSTSSYDNAGQLMSVTDARCKATSFTYDADGRKTAKYDTTGGALESTVTELASWTYDTLARGKLTSSTAYLGGTSYTEQVIGYNSYGLPAGDQTLIPSSQGALAGTYSIQYNYAPNGQLTSYTDSAAGSLPGETVTTGFDSAGEPTSLVGASSYVSSLTYTNLGQQLQYAMGTSAEPIYVTDSYDSQTGRLAEQNTQTGTSQTSVDDLHYTYDQMGNVVTEADTPSGASSAIDVQCFSYDYLGRLTQAWAQGSSGCASIPSSTVEGGAAPYWNAYSYDAAGNLTGVTATTSTGAVTTTANTYAGGGAVQPHAITAARITTASGSSITTYGYDVAGNLTTVVGTFQSQALTWNDAGQLMQDAVTPSGGSAQNTTYVYDANGALLLTADPGTTTLYLADEELSLNTATGTVTGTRYYSLGNTIVAARTGASSIAYLAANQQGTDSVAIDSATLGVTRRYFEPYGNNRGGSLSNFPTAEKSFVGGAADAATSLTDLGAREYRPGTGSFISPDQILQPYDPQDLNPYAYAKDNPSTLSDPSGQCTPGQNGCPSTYYDPKTGCRASTQQMLDQCIAAHTPKTSSGGVGGTRKGTAPAPSLVQISPHVYVSSNDPDGAKLNAAWQQYIATHGGEPNSALAEFNDWQQVCFRNLGLCTGKFGRDFNPSMAYTREVGITNLFRGGIDFVVTSVKMGAVLPVAIINAAYAQKWYSENFGAKGKFGGRTINDIADALKDGTLTADDVPINVIIRDGNTLILNTRSAQALTRAGIPRENWKIVDKTGNNLFERLLNGQLTRNGLDASGYDDPTSGGEGVVPGDGGGSAPAELSYALSTSGMLRCLVKSQGFVNVPMEALWALAKSSYRRS